MSIPDLISAFNSLGEALSYLIPLILAFMGLMGLWFGAHTLYDVWRHITGQNGHGEGLGGGIIARFALSGALAVAPVLLWRAANTFVLGGAQTDTMFAYLRDTSGGYCQTFSYVLTMFFMSVGLAACAYAATSAYSAANGRNHSAGKTYVWYFVGGVLLFFVNDVASIIGNTIGMHVGLENICIAMGS